MTEFRTRDGRTLQQAASDLVSREVHLCLSSMVSTLAADWDVDHVNEGMNELHAQAQELAVPVLDYEEAAREAGFELKQNSRFNIGFYCVHSGDINDAPEVYATADSAWQACCSDNDIEPHKWEVFEHWAVSTWLAEKLEASGERVDMDFAGLCVWARATTGQAISMDAVIESIARDVHSA